MAYKKFSFSFVNQLILALVHLLKNLVFIIFVSFKVLQKSDPKLLTLYVANYYFNCEIKKLKNLFTFLKNSIKIVQYLVYAIPRRLEV